MAFPHSVYTFVKDLADQFVVCGGQWSAGHDLAGFLWGVGLTVLYGAASGAGEDLAPTVSCSVGKGRLELYDGALWVTMWAMEPFDSQTQ